MTHKTPLCPDRRKRDTINKQIKEVNYDYRPLIRHENGEYTRVKRI